MKNIIVSVVILSLASFAFAQSEGNVVVASANATALRVFEAAWFPFFDPRVLELVGIEYNADPKNLTSNLDVVTFIISDFNGTELYFGYFHEFVQFDVNNSINALAEAAFAFVLQTYICYEFVEYNGIPGFQTNSTDQITGLYNLSTLELPWKPMVIDSYNVTDRSGHTFKVFSITIQTLDEVFLLSFTTADTEVKVGNTTIDSNTAKIDIELRWFTDLHKPELWTTGPSNATAHPNAQVGLASSLAAVYADATLNKTGMNTSSSNAPASVTLTAGGITGEFSWVNYADATIQGVVEYASVYAFVAVSGSSHDVHSVGEEELIFFSFNGSRPSLLAWDPTLGGSPSATPIDTTTSMPPMTMTTGMNMMMTTGAAAVGDSNTIAPLCFLIVALVALFF